jgi:hypothetical protein
MRDKRRTDWKGRLWWNRRLNKLPIHYLRKELYYFFSG